MNYAFARQQYKQSTRAGLTGISDPHEMIALTLNELSRCLKKLQGINQKDAQRNVTFSKAFTAIYILQTSLDFEKGGEISANLFKIYEYCRSQVQRALKHDPQAELEACAKVIDNMIDAWSHIK